LEEGHGSEDVEGYNGRLREPTVPRTPP
jgi:hypothetical protein